MSNQQSHIPNWEVIKLGDVTEIVKGGTPSRNIEKYFRGSIAWAIPSDISSFNTTLYINDTETHITEDAINNSAAILLPVGTVLLSSRATIGDTAINTVPMATNQGFANFICHDNLSNVFLAYYLRFIKKQLNDLASGSTFKEITKGTLLNVEIPDIPIQEQRAIAEVLSDVDGLINALDALIAKKRAIKQATMQQLLTGKTRLPGFSGEWETVKMGQIGSIYGGLSGKTKIDFERGNARYVTFLGVLENVILDVRHTERVHVGHGESQNTVMKDDLLFNASSETPGDLAIGAVMGEQLNNLYLNSFCFGFRIHDKHKYFPLFLAYFFRGSVGRDIMNALAQGATRYNLSKSQFRALELSIPSGEEQRAIAAVLSDMDAEIAALEQRRDKTIAIKQGMMQQLLTGKVRLFESRIIADNTDDAD